MGKNVKLKITESLLELLYEGFSGLYWSPYKHLCERNNFGERYYRTAVYRLDKQGLLKTTNKKGIKFLKLTAKGQLKVLMLKAAVVKSQRWDGKWRLIIFDIPEDAKPRREELRKLLLQNNFYKLQASVFINPYPLNREAINYLKQSGLISYIRMLRVDEVDSDIDLRKRFNI
ncbi:MAG TPA: CRISPR-associated endonuclease Cas2 [Candidatus Limnocylindria bacterium]|nr:CRISPR-associated endonuclease Cas2 [Candidatus Limnocylindria bacterium]